MKTTSSTIYTPGGWNLSSQEYQIILLGIVSH